MSTKTLAEKEAEQKFDWPLCYEAENFNQKSVSVIIELTDPRKQDAVHKYA